MSSKNMRLKTPLLPFPGGPVGHSKLPIQGGLGSIPGQEARSHMLQLKIACCSED